jgi:hypothetical protein
MRLALQPISFAEASEFVSRHHRHHIPPVGAKFSLGLNDGEKVVGVAIVGRPVARMSDNGWTLEVTRLCTDGTPNACSALYAACWRATRALGYRKLITFILDSEPGTSLLASNWRLVGECGGGSWSRASRPRIDAHPLQKKMRWEITNEATESRVSEGCGIAVLEQSAENALLLDLDCGEG